jgi:hypothetical protein
MLVRFNPVRYKTSGNLMYSLAMLISYWLFSALLPFQ